LHISSLNGHRQVAELLLDSGAHIHARDYLLCHTPLHCAATRGQAEVTSLLLDRGADMEITDNGFWTALQCAQAQIDFVSPGHEAVVAQLLRKATRQ
jgi:ankyrin repeat protein